MWKKDWQSFDKEDAFADQSPDGKARRRALKEVTVRGDLISYYEARSIPNDELIAMAVEYEACADEEFSNTGASLKGQSADSRLVHERMEVVVIPNNLGDANESMLVTYVSPFAYLIRLIDEQQPTRTMTIPTRMVFCDNKVSDFMRKELIAYCVAPEVRE